MRDESEGSVKAYRRLHIRIRPGEAVTDREGVTYVNESKSAGIRMTVVRENKTRKEVSSDASEPGNKQE
jgi:hypothetical protein